MRKKYLHTHISKILSNGFISGQKSVYSKTPMTNLKFIVNENDEIIMNLRGKIGKT